MKIVTNSIENLSEEFEHLQKSLEGANYCVSLEWKKFKFDNDFYFDLECLKKLFPNEDVRGKIVLSNFDAAKKDVKNAMSHFSYESGMVAITSDENITTSRESCFWNILSHIFSLPPKIIYKHEPDFDSYFGPYIMWDFCYIFLNEKKTTSKEGVVISGAAWD